MKAAAWPQRSMSDTSNAKVETRSGETPAASSSSATKPNAASSTSASKRPPVDLRARSCAQPAPMPEPAPVMRVTGLRRICMFRAYGSGAGASTLVATLAPPGYIAPHDPLRAAIWPNAIRLDLSRTDERLRYLPAWRGQYRNRPDRQEGAFRVRSPWRRHRGRRGRGGRAHARVSGSDGAHRVANARDWAGGAILGEQERAAQFAFHLL